MKAKEIRAINKDEMERKVIDLKEELLHLRFQHTVGQLENSQKLKAIKKDIARIKTIANELSKPAIKVDTKKE